MERETERNSIWKGTWNMEWNGMRNETELRLEQIITLNIELRIHSAKVLIGHLEHSKFRLNYI